MAIALAVADGARAQPPVPAPPLLGARVRVWASLDTMRGILTVRGRVVSTRPDTLVIDEEEGEPGLLVPLALVTRIDVSRGVLPRRQGILRGARRGLIVGLALAPLSFFEHWHPSDSPGGIARTAATATLFSGAIGVGVGGFLGTALNHTHWQRVAIPARVGAVPRGAMQLGVRLSL